MIVPVEPWQIALGIFAALLIGFAKTGLPGSGILMVPLMAMMFGGRLSVGATLPMLIFADVFAVRFYHAHAQFDKLRKLFVWVALGIAIGTGFLGAVGNLHVKSDALNPVIGWIVLAMVGLGVMRNRMGDRLTPHSPVGTAVVGAAAGFTTMVSNAAGPLMSIYFTSMGLDKYKFMGTGAWFFLIVNVAKLPLIVALTLLNPSEPMITMTTLGFNALLAPFLIVGALAGRHILKLVSQTAFEWTVMGLAAIAAIRLIAAS